MTVDFRGLACGDWLRIVLDSGESFSGMVVDYEHVSADDHTEGSVRFAFEGDLWEQVNDRVDSEVLHVSQRFARKTGTPKTAELSGHIVKDEMGFEYKKLGEIKTYSETSKEEVRADDE